MFNGWFSSIPGPDALQPRVRPLRHVVRPRRHERLLPEHAVQEHLPAARRGRQDRQDLLLRPARARRWRWSTCCSISRSSSARFEQFLTDCATAQLPDYSFVEPNYSDHDGDGGAAARLRPASRSPRARRRAVHRSRLQRDPTRTRSCGSRRRCSSPTTNTAASTITCRRRPARRTASSRSRRDRHRQAVHVRSARRARAGGAGLAVGPEGHGRPGVDDRRAHLRARVDSGDRDRLLRARTSTTTSDRPREGGRDVHSICSRSTRCAPTRRISRST